jgi:hypothetical protein
VKASFILIVAIAEAITFEGSSSGIFQKSLEFMLRVAAILCIKNLSTLISSSNSAEAIAKVAPTFAMPVLSALAGRNRGASHRCLRISSQLLD